MIYSSVLNGSDIHVSDKPRSAFNGHLSLVPYVEHLILRRHNVCSILPKPTDLVKAQLAVPDQLDGLAESLRIDRVPLEHLW